MTVSFKFTVAGHYAITTFQWQKDNYFELGSNNRIQPRAKFVIRFTTGPRPKFFGEFPDLWIWRKVENFGSVQNWNVTLLDIWYKSWRGPASGDQWWPRANVTKCPVSGPHCIVPGPGSQQQDVNNQQPSWSISMLVKCLRQVWKCSQKLNSYKQEYIWYLLGRYCIYLL